MCMDFTVESGKMNKSYEVQSRYSINRKVSNYYNKQEKF